MTPKDTPHTATQGASESSESLGRFGHHPDPAIDFCVEIEAIEAEIADLKAGLEPTMALQDRIDEAICFRVGGDARAVAAKNALRAALAQRQPAPADPQATELSMSMFATREDASPLPAPQEPAPAHVHKFRKIGGGRHYEQANLSAYGTGDRRDAPEPEEGYEWYGSYPLYAAPAPVDPESQGSQPASPARELTDLQISDAIRAAGNYTGYIPAEDIRNARAVIARDRALREQGR